VAKGMHGGAGITLASGRGDRRTSGSRGPAATSAGVIRGAGPSTDWCSPPAQPKEKDPPKRARQGVVVAGETEAEGVFSAAAREGMRGVMDVHEAAAVRTGAQAPPGVRNISSTTSKAAGSK